MIEIRNNENTAYSVATLINRILEDLEIDRQIPTQMMYNYTRNGMIVKGKKGSAKEIRYTAEEVVLFVNKWFEKNYKVSNVTTVATENTEIVESEEVEGQIELFDIEA